MAATGARRIDDIRRERQERDEGGYRVIREPGRTIVRDRDRVFIVHDETERFRGLDPDARVERRGEETFTFTGRPGGPQIVTITDRGGRLVRRVRRFPDGREVILINNGPRISYSEEVVVLPPPPLRIPRGRYVVNTERADERLIYDTLAAPPVAPVERRYSLDQVRSSPDLRARMRSVDINTLNFESASWTVAEDQVQRLATIARALKQAIQRNPNEVFLVEGYTDAVGNDVDNLSLSDRRAQSVATALTQDFQVPPENLTTQGYGAKYLKVDTQEASRENRRVTLRRITPLLTSQNDQQ